MTGRLIAVVGPSGVGKDTVMAALAAAVPNLRTARRVITRDPDAGGEAFCAVSETVFAQKQADGDFALSWQAHGLHYGIPTSVSSDMVQGFDVLANLSRSVLPTAKIRFPNLTVLALTASPDILKKRLNERGREDEQDIAQRIRRANSAMPDDIDCILLDNSGPLENTIQRALSALYPERSM